MKRFEHSTVILGHHFDEFGPRFFPQRDDLPGSRASRVNRMALQHLLQFRQLAFIEPFKGDSFQIAVVPNRAVLVKDVSNPAGHSGAKISPGLSNHNNTAAGHVFAAVIPNTLDDRAHAAVPDCKALSRHPADVGLPARRSVERHVSDDNVFFRRKGRALGRVEDQLPA